VNAKTANDEAARTVAVLPVETERRVEALGDEVDALRRSREKVFQAPPVEWINDRLENLHETWSAARRGRPRRCATCLARSAWSW
jgi:hypothetical protein